jgi:hypothetical protein
LPHPYKLGFITDGLFKYSRHPNFFCEFSMWWVIYFFSVNSIGFNWSGLGALLLNLLFLGSTKLTERISTEKYPAYVEYSKETSMLIPLLSKPKTKKIWIVYMNIIKRTFLKSYRNNNIYNNQNHGWHFLQGIDETGKGEQLANDYQPLQIRKRQTHARRQKIAVHWNISFSG